jgi:LmbE family N-acetylglucosaminyl deacetylase
MTAGSILMMATFGMEIVECGGALALHAQAGAKVTAAVAMARAESLAQIEKAAKILGVSKVDFLGWSYGTVDLSRESKLKIVQLIRSVRPSIFICQDPEHVQHDLDPDRRTFMLLYLESLALAGRDWEIEAAGGLAPHSVPNVYFMTPEHPNCVIEISAVIQLKEEAMAELSYQLGFSGKGYRERHSPELLRQILPEYEKVKHDDLALGSAMHRQTDRAIALYHGLAGHSGAVLGEAYRRMSVFVMDYLPG